MASEDITTPALGSGFSSEILPFSPSGGASMNASNMVSDSPEFGTPGSPSQATESATTHNPSDLTGE